MSRRAWPAAALIASLATPLAAQDADRVVSAATRYGQSTDEAPASVTVVRRDEIRAFGWRTLAEILAATGILTSYDRNYTYLTVRGLAQRGDFNTRILVLLDGRRLNAPADDAVGVGTEALVDVDALERVEVMRGPGSTLFGTNAFHAVVNLVTRSGAAVRGAEASLSAGSFDTFGATVLGGTRSDGGTDVFALASGFDSRGPDLDLPPLGRAAGLDGDRAGHLHLRVARGDFTLLGILSDRRKEIPTGSFDTDFGDPAARTWDGGGMVSAGYEHAFADLSRLWVTASWNSVSYSGDYPYEGELSSDYIRSRWLTLETQYDHFLAGQRVSVGGELRRNVRAAHAVTGVFERDDPSWVAAAFAQLQARLGDRATFYGGARLDHYESFGATVNPRLALVAEVADRTRVKALYGRAFRAPSSYELHYEDGGFTQKAAEDLEPERLETFEAVVERRLGPRAHAAVSVHHTRVEHLIGLVTDPADGLFVYRNDEHARSTGVEASVEGHVVARVFTRATWAFASAETGEGGRPVGAARHVAGLAASASLRGGRVVPSAELRHVSARRTLAGAEAGAYTLVDLGVLARPLRGDRFELHLRLGNALDATYADVGGEEHRQDLLPRDGRTVTVTARFRPGGR